MRTILRIAGAAVVVMVLGAEAFAADPCTRIPGVWSWFTNGDAIFDRDGTLTQGALTGTWTCTNRRVAIFWSHGFVDRLTLSSDGNHLTGSNGIIPVWGNRIH
jgi:hypothetical protein